jgi:hypothetical protein
MTKGNINDNAYDWIFLAASFHFLPYTLFYLHFLRRKFRLEEEMVDRLHFSLKK